MGDTTPRSAYDVHRRNSPREKIATAVSSTKSDRRSVKGEAAQEVTSAKSHRKSLKKEVVQEVSPAKSHRKSLKKEVVQKVSPAKSQPKVRRSNVSASQEMPSTNKRKMDSDEIENDVTEKRTVTKKKRGREKVMEDIITDEIETASSVIQEDFTVKKIRNVKRAGKTNENMSIIPKTSVEFNIAQLDGIPCGNEFAERVFNWLISPVPPETFFENFWEKIPLHIPRSDDDVFKKLFSSADVDKIVKENGLTLGTDVDVLKYVNGERQLAEGDPKVNARFIWSSYDQGNSIRLRNPQSFHKPLWNLCSHLQEYLSSYVGVNMYLTPPGTQGFPPHFDDIDAYVLQIEGKKHWKFYKARTNSEILARESSGDLDEKTLGKPFMEVDLLPGDVLYFPRGWIHQAKATDDSHSLHLTVSANQFNTWGDLIKEELSRAIEEAMKNDIEFRKTLPKDYLDFAGTTHSNPESSVGQAFNEKVMSLARKTLKYFSVDRATDAHAIDFIHGSLPPVFNQPEKARSVHGSFPCMKDGKVLDIEDLTFDTEIRLIRKRSFRLALEEGGIVRLYYSVANTRNHKEIDEVIFVDLSSDVLPAISHLMSSHPCYVKVIDLPLDEPEVRLEFANLLFDSGFLMTKEPLPLLSEDDS